MSKHQVIGDSPFLKRVLVPFWVVRILFMVLDIALYGLVIGAIAAYKSELDDELDDGGYDGSGKTTTTLIAIIAVVMILIIACLALDIVCIVKRARRTLSPKLFLIINVLQTTLWTVLFILSFVGGGGSGLAIILAIIVYLSFVGLLIYASVVFHRYRKGTLRGAYTPAINPALAEHQGLAYNPNPADHASYPSYPSHAAYGEPPKQGQYEMDTPQPPTYGYAPQTQGYPAQGQGYASQQHGYPQYGNVS